jgi:hypothetical protein
MSPVEQQFQILKHYQPEAVIHTLGDGSHIITIPSIQLPLGWNKTHTRVIFIAPVGYPLARPDCFWTDADLRLANGAVPQNTSTNPIPNFPGQFWWFSWHLTSWNPNNDNLLTYLNVIKRRLSDPK